MVSKTSGNFNYPHKFIKLSHLTGKWFPVLLVEYFKIVLLPRLPPEGMKIVGVYWLNLLPGF